MVGKIPPPTSRREISCIKNFWLVGSLMRKGGLERWVCFWLSKVYMYEGIMAVI
jgi:hypothetical protein